LDNLRSGSIKYGYWKELEKTQFFREDSLRRRQWQKVRALLDYIYEYNGFYRERFDSAGIKPKHITSVEDFRCIPVLSKQEIRENSERLISKGYNIRDLYQSKTGGSTGVPLKIYMPEKISESRNACARRHDRWSGWEVGEPIGAVWGNPALPNSLKARLRNRLIQPYIYLDTMNISDESVLAFEKQWQKEQPTLLFGHAHSIYLLAKYVDKLDVKCVSPKAILSTSMMLLPHERRFIEQVFGVKVTDRYGCEEVSLIASECERHDGMHLNIEHLYIEFIKEDGSPAKSGEEGNIVVTDLSNRAMPFIRYSVGDVGVPTDRKCGCGRGLPLMENVVGRVADFLVKHDGSKVAGISIIENSLTCFPGIAQMQIVQNKIDSVQLNIVKAKDFTERTERELFKYFFELFDEKVEIIFHFVDVILPEENGKYRFSICNILTQI
jgi:phenylacetate-CoA ligase